MIATILAAQFYDSVKNLHPEGSKWNQNHELSKVFAAMQKDGFTAIGHCKGHFFGTFGGVPKILDVRGFSHTIRDFETPFDMVEALMS